MILSQLTRILGQLLSVPPGDLVYHLIVLFAIDAVLMMAIGEGRRSHWGGGALRLTVAAAGLLVARGALVTIALLAVAGVTNPIWIMPPFERFAAVASLGLLAWAFLPGVDDYPQVGLVLVLVNLVGSAIFYAVTAPQWYKESQAAGAFYNSAPGGWDWAWSIWAAALALLVLIAAAIRRRAQWGMLIATFGLLLFGHVLHLSMADAQSHIAGWVRLAEMCAYPVLVGVMIHRASEREETKLPVMTAPWAVIETCQRVADASNIKVALQRAGVAISNVLNADALAIGLLNETGDAVELAAICHTGEPARSGPSFDLDSQLPVQSAISRQRGVMVGADQEAQRATLAALVGGAVGSLWVQPLMHQRTTVGVLIVGRPHMTSGWATSELQTLGGLCNVLAAALSAARKTIALTWQVDELVQTARDRETALSQAQAEAQRLSEQLAQAESQRRGVEAPAAARGADKAARPAAAASTRQPPPSESASTDMSAYRGLFSDEAGRHLQRFNESRNRLVGSPDDPEALSEMTRASYALREMAAMMGYNTLAKLTGALSDALRRAKDSRQPASPDLLVLIGESAQAMRALLADVQADRSPSVDTSSLLNRLVSLAGAGGQDVRGTHWAAPAPPPGAGTLIAQVRLNRDTPLKTARAMMVLMQIKRVGQVVSCQPVEADLRSGGFEDEFTVTFTTSSEPEAVRAALAAIPDAVSVDVRKV